MKQIKNRGEAFFFIVIQIRRNAMETLNKFKIKKINK